MIKYILVALLAAVSLAGDMPQDPFELEEQIIEDEIEMIEEDIEHHDMDDQDNIFDMIKEISVPLFGMLENFSDEDLKIECFDSAGMCRWNTETREGPEEEPEKGLRWLKEDFCRGANETETNNITSLMGIGCKKAFNFTDTDSCNSGPENCACIPCRIMTYVDEKVPMRLSMLRKVGKNATLEDLIRWAMETIEPISPAMIHQCGSKLIDSIDKCSKDYDGTQKDHIGEKLEWFNELETGYLFKSLKGLLSAYLGRPITTDGTPRPYVLHEMVVSLAKMVDNSMNSKECSANNLRRMSNTIFKIGEKFENATVMNDFVEAGLMLPQSFWCEAYVTNGRQRFKRVTKYMQKMFGSKCAYRGFLDSMNNRDTTDRSEMTPIHNLAMFVDSFMKKENQYCFDHTLVEKILGSMDPLEACFRRCDGMPKKERKICNKIRKKKIAKSGYKNYTEKDRKECNEIM